MLHSPVFIRHTTFYSFSLHSYLRRVVFEETIKVISDERDSLSDQNNLLENRISAMEELQVELETELKETREGLVYEKHQNELLIIESNKLRDKSGIVELENDLHTLQTKLTEREGENELLIDGLDRMRAKNEELSLTMKKLVLEMNEEKEKFEQAQVQCTVMHYITLQYTTRAHNKYSA